MSPTRAPHPCATPSCGTLVPAGQSHCDVHAATRRHTDPAQARFYRSSYWTKLSRAIRRQRPVCEMDGCWKPSKVVDHVDGDYRNNAPENHMALCGDCNRTKTARQHRRKAG